MEEFFAFLLSLVPQETNHLADEFVWSYDSGSWAIYIQEEPSKSCIMSKSFANGGYIEFVIVAENNAIDFYYGDPNLYVVPDAEYPIDLALTEDLGWEGEAVAYEANDGTPSLWLPFYDAAAADFMAEISDTQTMVITSGAALLGEYDMGQAEVAVDALIVCQGILNTKIGFSLSHFRSKPL